jgi:hypothetical protein
MSLLPIIRRTVRAQRSALIALGLLAFLTAFLVDAGPRTLVAGYDHAARDTVAEAPPAARDLVMSTSMSVADLDGSRLRGGFKMADAGGLEAVSRQWLGDMPPRLRDTIVGSEYFAATAELSFTGTEDDQVSVGLSNSVGRHIRYVSGRAPGEPTDTGKVVTVEAAVPELVARRFKYKPGDVVVLPQESELRVRISGVYTPTDAGDAYWSTHHRFEDVEIKEKKDGSELIRIVAMTSPAGYHALVSRTEAEIDVAWTYSPGAARVTAGTASGLVDDVHRTAEKVMTSRVDFLQAQFATRFDALLEDYAGRLRTTQTVLSLTLAGLFATGLGVLVLTGLLLLGRMRVALTTQAARGASPGQLAMIVACVAGVVAVPAVALGLALSALLVPGLTQDVTFVAAAVLVVTTVALPAIGAVRGGDGAIRTSPRRIVAEGLIILLAVCGTYLLRRRGLTNGGGSTGIDPLLSAVPALLAVSAGLLTLRAYPVPLRLACRVLARGRSAVSFIGFARASRRNATAVLPLLVLLLAVAVIGFGSTVDSSLTTTRRLSTWQAVGGDARVDAQVLDPALVDRVRHSPGVRAITQVEVLDTARLVTSLGGVSDELTVLGVDLDAYRRMMADTPLRIPTTPKGGGLPALLSPAAAQEIKTPEVTLSTDYGVQVPLRKVGTIARFPAQDTDGRFIVVPYAPLARATNAQVPGTIFVRGDHIDMKALRRNARIPALGAQGGNPVISYAESYRQITGGELGHLVGAGLGYAGLLVAGYGTLAILILLFTGTRARGQAVSYLRTLGLSRRQAHGLAVVEVTPPLFAALVVGWALGLFLPSLVGPALDLRPYTGGFPIVWHLLDVASTVLLVGGLAVFAGLAVLIDALVGARRRLGVVLRIGDS